MTPSRLFYEDQQGDNLGPTLFSMALQPILGACRLQALHIIAPAGVILNIDLNMSKM